MGGIRFSGDNRSTVVELHFNFDVRIINIERYDYQSFLARAYGRIEEGISYRVGHRRQMSHNVLLLALQFICTSCEVLLT
jgi:hypothetical protein